MIYKVSTIKQKFRMTVKEYSTYTYINFGGKNSRKTCIDIFVYPNGNAKLQQIDYDRECNLEGNMENGIGTRDMICASLYSVKELYPNISCIELDDMSTITCTNNKKVSLASYYLAFHSKTWYELYFKAVPNISDKQYYYTQKNKLFDSTIKKPLKWFDDLLIISNVIDPIKNILLDKYQRSSTYNDFFNSLKQYFDKNELCINTRDWIHQFITREIYNVCCQSWIIDLSHYECSSFIKLEIF